MKRTLERELKVPEVAEREAIETSPALGGFLCGSVSALVVRATGGWGCERALRGVPSGVCQPGLWRGENSCG